MKREEKRVMAVLPLSDSCWKEKISSLLKELQLPSHQIMTFAFDFEGRASAGLLLQSEDPALRKRPATLACASTEKNLAVVATENNTYVGPESFRIYMVLHVSS